MQGPIKLAVIYGSTREGRFGDRVVRWVAGRLAGRSGFEVDVIDPALPGVAEPETLGPRLDAADAFVIVTPEYNHSYPAPLKALIDSMKEEWAAKPVAFVSYGGSAGGARAVEHLRGVFAELDAVGIREQLSFANAWEQFDSEGRLSDEARAARAFERLLARLGWWASALRDARAATPLERAA